MTVVTVMTVSAAQPLLSSSSQNASLAAPPLPPRTPSCRFGWSAFRATEVESLPDAACLACRQGLQPYRLQPPLRYSRQFTGLSASASLSLRQPAPPYRCLLDVAILRLTGCLRSRPAIHLRSVPLAPYRRLDVSRSMADAHGVKTLCLRRVFLVRACRCSQ